MALPLRYNVRNLLARRASSAMAAGGSALTALLLVVLLAMGEGMQSSVVGQANPANVLLLHKGAPAEWSDVARDIPPIVTAFPQVATAEDGRTRASLEYWNTVWLPRDDGSETLVVLRGVEESAKDVYDWFHLDSGRWPQGSEILVGRAAAKRLDLAVGSSLEFGRRRWRVSGIFSARGNAAESQVWGDLDDFMADFRRDKLSVVTLRMRDVGSVDGFVRAVERDRRLADYEAKSESEYFEQEASFLGFMQVLAAVIAICMGCGAALGGMNVFFTSVAQRTAEIGMLRVLGFPARAVLLSFLAEALIVGLAGGTVGATLGLGANLLEADIWGSTFRFEVTGAIYGRAVAVGVLFALLGGLIPAIRAAKLRPILALRKG
jgi:ABC-type lipoprotein release transport system permease subunit